MKIIVTRRAVLDEINLDNDGRVHNLEREVQEEIHDVTNFHEYDGHLKIYKIFNDGDKVSCIYPKGAWGRVVRVE